MNDHQLSNHIKLVLYKPIETEKKEEKLQSK